MRDRYVLVLPETMQIDRFESVDNGITNFIVDLIEHPQKEEVQIGWYYNPDTNTFSEEDYRPKPIELLPELSANDEIQMELYTDSVYATCITEMTLE
jgi:hypothetical protein